MRISRVRIQGFRCLEDVNIPLDDVTTLIGPNGVGKSSVLRALDWFFNGSAAGSLSEDDLGIHTEDGRIRVEVEFANLTSVDREQLGSYAPPGATKVLLWRTWHEGRDVFSGNARSAPQFNSIRTTPGAVEKRNRYNQLRQDEPSLGLPAATTASAVDQALLGWEVDHPELLQDSEVASTTKFFGFLGGAKLSGIFDFVFVGADLRAADETEDSRTAAIGRLLERSIDRSSVTNEVEILIDNLNAKQAELVQQHLAESMSSLAADLTVSVGQFTAGRTIKIEAEPAVIKTSALRFATRVLDGTIQTSVAGQGHGFQRALLIAALKMVAERGRQDPTSGTILLAIEEPELYQHPTQARAFARVLRMLAEDSGQDVQVIYATHSPLFIEPGKFHQLRRMLRVVVDGQQLTKVVSADRDEVTKRLEGVVPSEQVLRQIDKACPQQLAEAVFADAAILVEGETDKAILDAVAERTMGFSARNISVIDVSGKDSLPLCGAILGALGISIVLVADNDADHRITEQEHATEKEKDSEKRAARSNRRLLKAVGAVEENWPVAGLHEHSLVFFEPDLEQWLRANWPDWEAARTKHVEDGTGYGGKHARTYFNAVLDAVTDPPASLRLVLEQASKLLDA